MANASVIAGTNRLKHAIQILREQWWATEPNWNDAVRRRFEERYVKPIEPAVDSALYGIQRLGEVLDRIRRECSDRSENP